MKEKNHNYSKNVTFNTFFFKPEGQITKQVPIPRQKKSKSKKFSSSSSPRILQNLEIHQHFESK